MHFNQASNVIYLNFAWRGDSMGCIVLVLTGLVLCLEDGMKGFSSNILVYALT